MLPRIERAKQHWICIFGFAAAIAVGILLFLTWLPPSAVEAYLPVLRRIAATAAAIFGILWLRAVLEKMVWRMKQPLAERYTLVRVVHLISNLLLLYAIVGLQFRNTYTFLTGLGLASLVLGFALQAPISSFIGWLYIIFRRPYQLGERIQINGLRGDVIEISYLDTIIRECSGDYLGNDRLSGRTIHFPNSLILTDRVINYSEDNAPFIWNETAIQVAYTADVAFIEDVLVRAANTDFAERFPHLADNSDYAAQTYVRTNAYAWLELVVTYPVEPTDTTGRRNRILKRALPELNASPDRVQFPAGTSR